MHCKIAASFLFASQVSGVQSAVYRQKVSDFIGNLNPMNLFRSRRAVVGSKGDLDPVKLASDWVAARKLWVREECVPSANKIVENEQGGWEVKRDLDAFNANKLKGWTESGVPSDVSTAVKSKPYLAGICESLDRARPALDNYCSVTLGKELDDTVKNPFRELYLLYDSEIGTGKHCNPLVSNDFIAAAEAFLNSKKTECHSINIAVKLLMESYEEEKRVLVQERRMAAENYVASRKPYIQAGCVPIPIAKEKGGDIEGSKGVYKVKDSTMTHLKDVKISDELYDRIQTERDSLLETAEALTASKAKLMTACLKQWKQDIGTGFLPRGAAMDKEFTAVVNAYDQNMGAEEHSLCKSGTALDFTSLATAFLTKRGGQCESLDIAVNLMKNKFAEIAVLKELYSAAGSE